MSVDFHRESPGKFDSRTLNRKTLSRWTGRITCSTAYHLLHYITLRYVTLHYIIVYHILVDISYKMCADNTAKPNDTY